MRTKIVLIKGDITNLKVDALVNAANSSLLGGGGVDGAIHRAAGEGLLEECKLLNGCKTGEAKITEAYLLPASFVIHTVGPVFIDHHEEKATQLLKNAYENSLKLGQQNDVKSIAFPNISTGVYGYPKTTAAQVSIGVVQDFISVNQHFEKIVFCCFDQENYLIYKNLLESK